MKLRSVLFGLILVFCVFSLIPLASAVGTIEYVALGATDPPTELGGYGLIGVDMTGFREFDRVTSVPSVLGDILFQSDWEIEVRAIPTSWSLFNHDYDGFVFFVSDDGQIVDKGTPTAVTLTLPVGVKAFVVYVMPDYLYTPYMVEVTVNDGSTYSQEVTSSEFGGAKGFGFSTTGDSTIQTVTIHCYDGFGFSQMAIGFGTGDVLTLEETGANLLPQFQAIYAQILADRYPGHTITDVVLTSPGGSALIAPGTYDAVLSFKLDGVEMVNTIAGGLIITPKKVPITPGPDDTLPPAGDTSAVASLLLLGLSGMLVATSVGYRRRFGTR